MKIHSIGYHHGHDADFVMSNPNGIGQVWLFLLFQTKALIRRNGKEEIAQAGSFLLYSGNTPQYYAACDDTYMDDWFYFTVEPQDQKLFPELGIPLNQPVQLTDAATISAHIRSRHYNFCK